MVSGWNGKSSESMYERVGMDVTGTDVDCEWLNGSSVVL